MSLYYSIFFPSVLALFTIYKNKLTISGVTLAWIFGVIICYYGGFHAFVALALTCILILITDRIKKVTRDDTRNIYQIISTLLTPTICIILYAVLNQERFYIMYYVVIASSLADSFASSIGTLSKKKPFNIFTLEKIETGDSGGASILGFIASLVGGLIIATLYLTYKINITAFLVITFLAFMGSLIDTILGLIFQAQYRCIVCRKVIETRKHCGNKTKLIKGYPFMDNNLVNLLSNIAVFLISYDLLK